MRRCLYSRALGIKTRSKADLAVPVRRTASQPMGCQGSVCLKTWC
ncbi:unnamed protein product [Ectocarpus sp. 12 AP-2014]